ncbi:hypothetical protein KC357_g5 [Hortaea werneckii]|nr:hypothetical protein KC357_g5 [Hortaea werneckii]
MNSLVVSLKPHAIPVHLIETDFVFDDKVVIGADGWLSQLSVLRPSVRCLGGRNGTAPIAVAAVLWPKKFGELRKGNIHFLGFLLELI